MNKEDLIDKLLEYFYIENRELKDIEVPEDEEDKRNLLDNIIAKRPPEEIDQTILDMESKLLKIELEEKRIVNSYEIETIDKTLLCEDEFSSTIALWQGDITRLKVDAIINNTNETLLGCSIENHKCIDRLINSKAGIALKLECNEIVKNQAHTLSIGEVKLTNSYNLPCNYIIHTVGPKVYGDLTEENKKDLAKCYSNILELAKQKELKTIAIPCISTGEYHFPKNEAAIVAVNSIKDFLKDNKKIFSKIIIDVYTNEDYNEYKKLF